MQERGLIWKFLAFTVILPLLANHTSRRWYSHHVTEQNAAGRDGRPDSGVCRRPSAPHTPVREGALGSWGCHSKLPQTCWLKATGLCSLTVLEARSLKSRCWWDPVLSAGPRGESVHALPAAGGCWRFLTCGYIIVISASVSTSTFSVCLL